MASGNLRFDYSRRVVNGEFFAKRETRPKTILGSRNGIEMIERDSHKARRQ